MPWKFPDAEAVMCDLIEPLAPASTYLADGWEQQLPQVEVHRVGGSSDDVTDTARIQVAVYHETRALVWALASDIRERILAVDDEGEVVNGVLIDAAYEVTAGQQVPDIDPDDRRVISTYQLSFRRQNLP